MSPYLIQDNLDYWNTYASLVELCLCDWVTHISVNNLATVNGCPQYSVKYVIKIK